MSAKHAFGWKRDLPDQRDLAYPYAFEAARAGLTSFPVSVDLRPGMPPVYDQGQLGSCTANAIAAAVEFEQRKQGLSEFMPSRLFVYYNERKDDGDIRSDAGSSIRESAKAVANYGVCPEALWPYNPAKFASKPQKTAYAVALLHKVTSYMSVQQTGGALKTCLASGYPVAIGFTVYESFESAAVASSGNAPMPAPHEAVLGGHAVLLCGYDDASQTWLLRNSWGASWGQAGYFTLPYAYLTNPKLASDFWTLRAET